MSKRTQGPVTGFLINPEQQTIEAITLTDGGHSWELNSFKGLLQTMEQEAAS